MGGNAVKMARLKLQFDNLRQDLLPGVVAAIASRALELTQQGFVTGTSPGDAPWAPTKAGNPPLHKTGTLASSFSVRLEGGRFGAMRFVLATSVHYAIFNQGRSARRGGYEAPARPQLPARNKLGPTWARELRLAARGAMAAVTAEAGGSGGGGGGRGGGAGRGANGRFTKKT